MAAFLLSILVCSSCVVRVYASPRARPIDEGQVNEQPVRVQMRNGDIALFPGSSVVRDGVIYGPGRRYDLALRPRGVLDSLSLDAAAWTRVLDGRPPRTDAAFLLTALGTASVLAVSYAAVVAIGLTRMEHYE